MAFLGGAFVAPLSFLRLALLCLRQKEKSRRTLEAATGSDRAPRAAARHAKPYQPTVTVAIVGAAVCNDELKPPTSSYAKPYDRPFRLWSCQNFEYELAGDT